MFRREDDANTPLKPTVYLILLSLAEEERHGYGIVKAIEAREPGTRIEPANLYRTLRTMESEGLIADGGRRPDPELTDSRRRYFRITARGARAARRETERLEGWVRHARTLKPLARKP